MNAPSTSPPLLPPPAGGGDGARRELTEQIRALCLDLHGPRIGCCECARLVTT